MKKFVIFILAVVLLILGLLAFFMPSDILEKVNDRSRLRSLCTQRVIDRSANGLIEASEIENAKERILLYDENKDGRMSRAELGGVGVHKDSLRNSKIFSLIDANGDSEFSVEELNNAKFVIPDLDLNKDGVLERSEYH